MVKIVTFILGRAGSGKSKKMNEIIAENIKLGNEKILVIVPEQISFEKEKSMLEYFGNKDFSKIKVLSFSRLCDFVPNMLKLPNIESVGDAAQVIMVNEAIELSKPKLKMYLKSSSDMNLAKLLLNTIHELKSNKISIECLKNIYNSCKKEILRQKIKEIILIYENLYENSFSHRMDNLSILENMIKANNVFEDYTIFFDEFSNFTPQQFSLLEEIMKQSKDIYMAFCADEKENSEYGLFSPTLKTISKVKEIAVKNFIISETTYLPQENSKFQNSDLKILEKNIFRPKKEISEKSGENIFIYNALDLNDEINQVAITIRKLVMSGKYRYKDFTVLTRDMQSYESVIKSFLGKYSIPYFVDTSEKLFNKNLTNLILSAFDAVHSGFSAEDILRFLKTDLVGFSAEEISILENYVLMWNINSEAWKKDFSMHPKGYYNDFEEEDLKNLEEINLLRKRAITPLENFKAKLKNKTGRGISIAVYELLKEVNAAENLRNFCETLEKNCDYSFAEKHAMTWDILMEVLDQISSLTENKRMSSKKYVEILNLALNFSNFSYVPQCIDNVAVASVERSLATGAKVVFIVGAANGEFPKISTSSEIFSDQEVNYISSLGIKLKDTAETFFAKERFLAYTALTSPSEMLFVSWPSSDSFGKSKYPSEIIKEIKAIFPSLKIYSKDNFSDEDHIISKSSAFEIYAKTKKNSSEMNFTLKKFLSLDEKYKSKCEMIDNLLDKNRLNFSDLSLASELFGETMKLSASRIEKYYKCRFAYFCEYGLKAKVRENTAFGVMDYGNLIHFLFEKLFKNYSDAEIVSMDDERLEKEVSKLLEKYINEKLGGFENKPKIFTYTVKRLKGSVIFLVKYLSKELCQSDFKVLGTELEISKSGNIKPLEMTLSNGKKVIIEGKIDRADIMSFGKDNFIRIIDYKTGNKQFKLSDVFYGLNMQMLIYLLAIKENGIQNLKNIIPAGILYFTAIKPLVEAKNLDSDEKTTSEISKKLKMNGLILEDKNVILGMEKEGKGEFIPAVVNGEEIKKSDSIISLNGLEIAFKHIKRLITIMCNDLLSGKTSASPIISTASGKACKYCDYHCICGYEEENFKKISSMKNSEVLEKMKESDS